MDVPFARTALQDRSNASTSLFQKNDPSLKPVRHLITFKLSNVVPKKSAIAVFDVYEDYLSTNIGF